MGWQWHQLDHVQIICTLLQTDNHACTSALMFYRPDALPDAQPTVCRATKKKWLKTENKTALTGNPFVMGKFMLNITMRARNRVAVSTGLATSHKTLPAMHTQKSTGKGFPYSMPSIGPAADPDVQAQPTGDRKSSTRR